MCSILKLRYLNLFASVRIVFWRPGNPGGKSHFQQHALMPNMVVIHFLAIHTYNTLPFRSFVSKFGEIWSIGYRDIEDSKSEQVGVP